MLYLLCGKSFSGKSTLAASIADQTGALVVSLDAINAERGLFGGLGMPAEEWSRSHQLALRRAEEALSAGLSVVVDDTNCFRFLRDDYRSLAVGAGAQCLLLYLDASLDTLLARMHANAQVPSRAPVAEDVFLELHRKFQAPTPDEHPSWFPRLRPSGLGGSEHRPAPPTACRLAPRCGGPHPGLCRA